MKGAWTVRLFGGFSLTRPDGQAVRLPDRNVEGLLALLVVDRQYGTSRRTAAEVLWPSRAPEHLTNLRQSLLALRRSLGEGSIEASRHHLRLASHFALESDYERSDLRKGGFMPGHEGEWFEEVRLGDAEQGGGAEDSPSILSSFVAILDWYRVRDPEKLVGFMQADLPIAMTIPAATVGNLVESIPDSASHVGWKAFWKGHIAMRMGHCEDADVHLRAAFDAAKDTGDDRLGIHSGLELCGERLVRNRLQSALRIADLMGEAYGGREGRQRGMASIAKGLVLLHSGEAHVGLDLLHDGERWIDDASLLVIRKAMRAYLEASVGRRKEAESALTELFDWTTAPSNPIADVYRDMAQSALHAITPPSNGFEPAIDRLVVRCQGLGNQGVLVYGTELAAVAYAKAGDLEKSRREFKASRKMRKSCGMAYTAWDWQRLRGLVASLKRISPNVV